MSKSAEYALHVWVSGKRYKLASNSQDFEAVLTSRADLLSGIAFEQRIDLALENFLALEQCLIEMALRNAIFLGEQDVRLRHARHNVNRHLANFMSSARLYVDQTTHELSSLFGDSSNQKARFVEKSNEEFDSHLGYRAFQALRNYVQHRGLPVHSITFSSKSDSIVKESKDKNTVSIALSPDRLREDGKFKKQVLAELDMCKDKKGLVDLMELAREYAGCLGRLHGVARDLVSERLHQADGVFQRITDYVENEVGSRQGLILVSKLLLPERAEETETVDERLTEDRKLYEEKNRYASYVGNQYVSSSC